MKGLPQNQDYSDEGIDRERIKALHAYMEPDDLKNLALEFCRETTSLLEAASLALQQNEIKEAKRIVHSLKGEASTLGGIALARKLAEIEARIREDPESNRNTIQKDLRKCSTLLADFRKAMTS